MKLHFNTRADTAKAFSLHADGCAHGNIGTGRKGGGASIIDVTGKDDPIVKDVIARGFPVKESPCLKKASPPQKIQKPPVKKLGAEGEEPRDDHGRWTK